MKFGTRSTKQFQVKHIHLTKKNINVQLTICVHALSVTCSKAENSCQLVQKWPVSFHKLAVTLFLKFCKCAILRLRFENVSELHQQYNFITLIDV